MGRLFKGVSSGALQNKYLVANICTTALALFLYKNEDLADELKTAFDTLIVMLDRSSIATQEELHEELTKIVDTVLSEKPIYVKVAFTNLLNTIIDVAGEKIEDELDILSAEEEEAWLFVLKKLSETCEVVLEEV